MLFFGNNYFFELRGIRLRNVDVNDDVGALSFPAFWADDKNSIEPKVPTMMTVTPAKTVRL